MRRRDFALMLLAAPAIGCGALAPIAAALAPVLSQIVLAATDAEEKVATIERVGLDVLEGRTDPQLLADFQLAVANVKATIELIRLAGQGGEALTQNDVDAAFESFRQAWQILEALLPPLGITQSGDQLVLLASAGDVTVTIDAPLALGETPRLP